MNIGGGEAADQLVRMMLSGSEVAVRLSGSAIKNMLALTMALAKTTRPFPVSQSGQDAEGDPRCAAVRHVSGAVSAIQAAGRKTEDPVLCIRDSDNKGKVVDVIMPVTEIDRAI